MDNNLKAEIDKLYLEKCQEVNRLTEQVAQLKKQCPPCRIGQDAWYVRIYNRKKVIRQGVISEMFFLEDMTLIAVVKNIGRGVVGETVFLTYEAAKKARGGK